MKNVQELFRKWFDHLVPSGYKDWYRRPDRRLEEIKNAYFASFGKNVFEIDEDNIDYAIDEIISNLRSKKLVSNRAFTNYNDSSQSGIPNAILNKWLTKFLRDYPNSLKIVADLENKLSKEGDIEASCKGYKKKIRKTYEMQYYFFSHYFELSSELEAIISCFKNNYDAIKSPKNKLNRNGVLKIISNDLKTIGFKVKESKKEKIYLPVLFDNENNSIKSFEIDAISADEKIIVEVEAGGAFENNNFLKDVFQACMIPSIEFLVIAVRNVYRSKSKKSKKLYDYSEIYNFFETLYANGRLQLPLKGIVLIGY